MRMPQLATRSVRVLAIPLLLAGLVAGVAPAASASAARTAVRLNGVAATAAAKFSGCLVTDTEGIHKAFNKVAWQGMQAAAAAEPSKIQVRFLASETVSDYIPEMDTFIEERCGLIVTVGPSSAMAQATELSAKGNPKVHYAIVDCSYQSHCLTGPKLKNLSSVKGTASAVKTEVLATANGT